MSNPTMHRKRFVLRALTLAIAAGGAGGVQAARLGGATVLSAPGEPLAAQVGLLATPAELAAARASLRGPISATTGVDGTIERLGLRAFVDPAGVVRIESDRPLDAGAVELRLALQLGERTLVRHYRLAPGPVLPPAVAPASPAAPAAAATVVVRRGDTAWGIARRLWPARRDLNAAVAALVAANPHAFVGGDADRLLAGAELTVPGAAPADTAPAVLAAQSPPAPRAAPAAAPASEAAAVDVAADAVPAGGPPAAVASPATTTGAAVAVPEGVDEPAPTGGATATPTRTPVDLEAVDRRLAAARAFLEARRSGRADAPLVATQPAPRAAPASLAAAPVAAVAVQPLPAPARADAGWRDAFSLPRLAGGLSLLLLLAFAHRWRRRALAPAASVVDPVRLDAIRAKAASAEPVTPDAAQGVRVEVEGTDPLESSMAAVDDSVDAGRYEDAVRMLERVLGETTNTHRALLRLAELHYLTNQAEDFARLAERLHREFRSRLDDAEWARLQEMGRRLCPDHPLFGGPMLVRTAS